MIVLRWLTVPVLLLGLTACGTAGAADRGLAPSGADPDGRTFVVTGVTDAGKTHDLVKGSEIRLRFDGDRLVVTAGCNTMSGGFTLEGTRLTVEPMSSTEMGCAKALMDQDTWVAGLFARPTQLSTGNDAALISGAVVLALADREVVSPDRPLVGQRWVLTGTSNGETASSVGVGAFLTIAANGSARIDERCGWWTTDVTVVGDQLTWGPLVDHPHSCPLSERRDEEAGVHRALRDVLVGTTTATVVEQNLTITHGADALTFAAVPKAL